FSIKILEVPDLRVDMMTSILIHGLKKGALASTLKRDPLDDVEELLMIDEKVYFRRGMNILKENNGKKKGRKGKNKAKADSEKEQTPALKDEIERLIRNGYLKEFIAKQKGKKHEEHSPWRKRSRYRNRESKRERPKRRDDLSDDNQPRRGVINTISGGPSCVDS
ncbi:UNVERIFIED_CONTAM: hypothetical protein Sindi_2855900, partial [Sesamum indicum]